MTDDVVLAFRNDDEPIVPLIDPPLTPEQIDSRRREQYALRSDPLFFKAHAGELGTVEDGLAVWSAEREAIRAEYPDPEG